MKFRGLLATDLSGSLAGLVASHNAGGTYFRDRAIPTVSTTIFAIAAKNRLATTSQQWQGLTDAQRLSWSEWAVNNPVSDRIGARITLAGNMAYVSLNTRLLLAGFASVATPPIVPAPASLASLTLHGDIGAGAFDLDFTVSPLPADNNLWVREAVVNSAGINYIENKLRVVTISPAAQATPLDNQVDVEARLGTLVVGQKLVAVVSVLDSTNGQLSAPLRAEIIISSTP